MLSGWIIASWVFVVLITGINVFVFLKLKEASEQMMRLAFPNAKNMKEAMSGMQKQMGMMGLGGKGANQEQQLKAAMDMLQNLNKRR